MNNTETNDVAWCPAITLISLYSKNSATARDSFFNGSYKNAFQPQFPDPSSELA